MTIVGYNVTTEGQVEVKEYMLVVLVIYAGCKKHKAAIMSKSSVPRKVRKSTQ